MSLFPSPVQLKQTLLSNRRVIFLLVFVVLALVCARYLGLRQLLNPQVLQHALQENPARGVAIFVLLFALGNLAHLPGWIFLVAAVYAFGPAVGGLLTYLAANVSCALTFLMIRAIGGNFAGTLKAAYAVRLLARLHAHPVRNVAILRTALQTLPTLNYALAITGIGFRHHAIGTLLGLPLPIAMYCLFFDFLIGFAQKV